MSGLRRGGRVAAAGLCLAAALLVLGWARAARGQVAAPPEADFGSPSGAAAAGEAPAAGAEAGVFPAGGPDAGLAAGPGAGSGLTVLRQFDAAFSAIFETASPSVVVIRVDKEEAEGGDFDAAGDPEGFGFGPLQNEGSGFLLDDLGHIATNLHVIEGAKKIRVRLKDGREYLATKVGADDKTDIAVIKITAAGLVPARLGDSDKLRVGQLVATIGAPYNLDYSFTLGIISGLGRTNFNVAAFEEYIQTDASINPGNSGGPLLDVEGRVIGMTTLVNGINRGLGFAIPVNMVREVAAELVETGRVSRPWLGIGIDNYSEPPGGSTQGAGAPRGVVVRSIAIESPAYGTDLRAGDVIVAVEGKAVATTRELQKHVLAKKIGDPITLTLNRKGKIVDVTIKTAELPDTSDVKTAPQAKGKPPAEKEKDKGKDRLVKPEMPSAEGPAAPGAAPSPEPPAPALPRLPDAAAAGLEIEPVQAADAARLGLPDAKGLMVKAVVPGGPAAKANLAKGDVIVAAGALPVGEPEELWRALAAEPEKGVTLTVVRGGRRGVTTLAVPKME